jgi:hypothetical protein
VADGNRRTDPPARAAGDPAPGRLELARQAMAHLERAESWPALRDSLEAAGLTRQLGADGMQRLADIWRDRMVRALDDPALIAEIRFWADGGDFPHHPDGFRAPLPADLAAEAGRRGWFVRALEGGGWVVNAPGQGPLSLPARR